jgi:Integrase core domain
LTAIANAMAESFVDTFKTELIKDRVWQSRSQVELAALEYINWFNNRRLHESLGDIPPVEFEQLHADDRPFSGDLTVAALRPNSSDGLTERRLELDNTKIVVDEGERAKTAPQQLEHERLEAGLCEAR